MAEAGEAARELAWPRLLAYAAPALPLAAVTLPLIVFVPSHYAAKLGLPIAAVGWVLLTVRAIDAFADPLVGALADRWRPAFGRRRLWTLCGALLTAMAAFALFAPPDGAGITYLFCAGAAVSVAYSIVQVPYLAWGAELSRGYAGRTRVAAFREGATAIGAMLALLTPALVSGLALGAGVALPAPMSVVALLVALFLPLLALVCVGLAPEPVERGGRRLGWREGLIAMRGNRPFWRLLAAFFLNGLASGLPASLFLLFVEYRLARPDAAGALLALYFACGVIGVPLWFRLAQLTSKHRAWAASMLLACIGFAPAAFVGPGDLVLFGLVCVVAGLALGADIVLPAAMQGDVIDQDTLASGEERTAAYLGLWTFAAKFALAAAVGVGFPILAVAGFDPGRGLVSGTGLTTLAFVYAVLPIPLKLAAAALVWRFPIDAAAQARLAQALRAKRH